MGTGRNPSFALQVHWKVFGGKSSSICLKTIFDGAFVRPNRSVLLSYGDESG